MMSHRLLAFAGCLLLTGCQMLMPVNSKQPQSVVRDHERVPSGEALATLATDESKTRWTVEVRQPYSYIVDEITVQPEGVRRYLWWPLAPLSGLLQCPAGLVASLFSDSAGAKTLRQTGCLRLIGMEPLKGIAERRAYETVHRTLEEDTAPVAGIAVSFTPQPQEGEVLRGLTDRDGLFALRHSSLVTTEKAPISGRLDVTGPHGKLMSRSLTLVPSTARIHTPISLPPNYPVIIQINSFRNADGSPNPTILANLTANLLKAGVCLTAGPTETTALIAELNAQLGMRIDDSEKVRTGRLRQPTLIIEGSVGNAADPHLIHTSLYVAKTGERIVLEEESEAELSQMLVQQLGPKAKGCGEN